MKELNSNQAGKGDSPRSCFSKKYRDNYDSINWSKKNEKNNTKHIDVAPPPKRGLSAH